MTQHTCRGHRTTHRSWLFPSAVWVSGIELRLLSIWSTFSWSVTHCSHLSGKKQRQKNPTTSKTSLTLSGCPTFLKDLSKTSPFRCVGLIMGGLGRGTARKEMANGTTRRASEPWQAALVCCALSPRTGIVDVHHTPAFTRGHS